MNLQSSNQHSWYSREENGAQAFKKILVLEKKMILFELCGDTLEITHLKVLLFFLVLTQTHEY